MVKQNISYMPEANDDPACEKEILNQKMQMLNDRYLDGIGEVHNFIYKSHWKLSNLAY